MAGKCAFACFGLTIAICTLYFVFETNEHITAPTVSTRSDGHAAQTHSHRPVARDDAYRETASVAASKAAQRTSTVVDEGEVQRVSDSARSVAQSSTTGFARAKQGRTPVPTDKTDGACDRGLRQAGIVPSCTECNKYYDGRTDEDSLRTCVFAASQCSARNCVFVPSENNCFPAEYARDQGMETEELCQAYQRTTTAPASTGVSKPLQCTERRLTIWLEPLGGLGNQLFELSALLAVAEEVNNSAELACSVQVALPRTERTLDGRPVYYDSILSHFKQFAQAPETLRAQSTRECTFQEDPHAEGMFSRTIRLPSGAQRSGEWPGEHWTRSLADEVVKAALNGCGTVKLQGYWQDRRYFDSVLPRLRKLFWHTGSVQRAEAELQKLVPQEDRARAVSIHLRLTDTAGGWEVADEYFPQATDIVQRTVGGSSKLTCVLFSDDQETARGRVGKYAACGSVVLVPAALDPVTSFYMMSLLPLSVVSASSYSFWASVLGSKSVVVVPDMQYHMFDYVKQFGWLRVETKHKGCGGWCDRPTARTIWLNPLGGLGNQLFQFATLMVVSDMLNNTSGLYGKIRLALPDARQTDDRRPLFYDTVEHHFKQFVTAKDALQTKSYVECTFLENPHAEGNFHRTWTFAKQAERSRLHGQDWAAELAKPMLKAIVEPQPLCGKPHGCDLLKLQGYFQDSKYYQKLLPRLRELFWHKESVQTADAELSKLVARRDWNRSVAVHLRLTDTAGGWEVDDDYFPQAIDLVAKKRQEELICVIFSDDSNTAWKRAGNFRACSQRVLAPASLDTVTSFYMMSLLPNGIVSTSSYSFWANLLGKKQVVVAPNVQYRMFDYVKQHGWHTIMTRCKGTR